MNGKTLIKNNEAPVCHVYTASFIENIEVLPIFSKERNLDIESTSNLKVKRQKYLVWKLLERALYNSFGLDYKTLNFYKTEKGKWKTDGVYFSLSHSHGALAVCLSNSEVGVDIELIDSALERAVERVLTRREKELTANLSGIEKTRKLACIWSQKESVYKRDGKCVISKIETQAETVETKIVTISGEEYALSLATTNGAKIYYHENVENFVK